LIDFGDHGDLGVRFQTIGEGDECTCWQCRGGELPEWLARLVERVEEPPAPAR
jgi:hypothetical protein